MNYDWLCRTNGSMTATGMRQHRVPHGALERLEPCTRKRVRTVLRGGSGGNAASLLGNAGNISTKWQEGSSPLTMVFDAANRITTTLQSTTLTTVSYDNNGNQTEENALGSRTTYIFDNENRLTSVKNPDGTRSTYTYDGDGLRRTAQEPGATVHTMIWDGDDYFQERT